MRKKGRAVGVQGLAGHQRRAKPRLGTLLQSKGIRAHWAFGTHALRILPLLFIFLLDDSDSRGLDALGEDHFVELVDEGALDTPQEEVPAAESFNNLR